MIHFISSNKDLFNKPSNGIILSTIDDAADWLDCQIGGVFGVDTETEGFFDHNNNIIMLQFGDESDQYVIDVRGMSKAELDKLKPYFESDEAVKILHNAKFDLKFFKFTLGWEITNIWDTLVVECCLTNGIKDRGLSLDKVVSKYCGSADVDKSERNQFIHMNGRPFTEKQIVYGANDVKHLIPIMGKQIEEANKWQLMPVIGLENKTCVALADIEYNGAYLDKDEWLALANKAENKMKEYEKKLDSMALTDERLKPYIKKYVQGDLFGGEIKKLDIKWSSPTQVEKVFKTMGLEIDGSGALEVAKYQNKEPLVKAFLDFKKEQKLTTTYGEDFLKYINPRTGRVHTDFWQVLDTHRISSNKPNLQQIPAKTEKRADGTKFNPYFACFKAPRGLKIVGADFAGQELRLIAEGSQDPVWLECFNEGGDLHGRIASMLFGIPEKDVKDIFEFVMVGDTKVFLRDKSPRDVTKTINFGLAYGMSEYKLSDTLGIEVKAAKAIIDAYFDAVPLVKAFLHKLRDYGLRNKYTRSYRPYCIVRQFKGYDFTNEKDRGDVGRRSMNTPIQGTGAQMCKLALVDISSKIKKVDYHVEIFLQVHDAIYCYVDENYAEQWAPIQKEIMEEAGRVFIKSIPVISDVKISDKWEK